MSGTATRAALATLSRPLLTRAAVGGGAIVAGLVLATLATAAWLARAGAMRSPWWVLVAWGIALAGAVWAGASAWRRTRALRAGPLATTLEAAGAWRAGALTGLFAPAAADVSGELYRAADVAGATEVAARGPAAVAPMAAMLRRRVGVGSAALALGAIALLGASPASAPVRMLWHPREALALALGTVRLEASSTSVERGAEVRFLIRAPGRASVSFAQRAPGEGWAMQEVLLDSLGTAQVRVGPLSADLFAVASAGGRASDTLHVIVRLPPLLGSVGVAAKYPAYLGLEDEPLAFGPTPILLPEGTRLVVEGEATAPLATAAWDGPGGANPLTVRGGRFEGRLVPSASGRYALSIVTLEGAELGGEETTLELRIVPDSAPQVAIPVPGTDTIAPIGLAVPLVVDAADDHGLASLVVVSRRISRLGEAGGERRVPVPLPAGAPDRVLLPFALDLEGRSLLPGDTVRYYAEATDNAPRPRIGRSREYILRLPTMAEVRAAERAATESVGAQIDSLAAESRRLQRTTEDLSRTTQRPSGENGRPGERSLSFEAAKEAEAVAERQEELVRQAEAASEAIAELQRAAQEAGIQDPEFQRRMSEIAEQLDRALTPEMREQLAALREALKNLDAAQVRQALENLAEAQRQMREALERSQELFERAALEGDLANLAAEARDLAAQQSQWNEGVPRADSARAAAEQSALAERADSLAAGLAEASDALTSREDQAQAERMAAMSQEARAATSAMRQASDMARQGKRAEAQRQGRQAEQRLQSMGDRIDEQRESMQEAWRQEVSEAIERMMAETSRLADQQLKVSESVRAGEAPERFRSQQAAIEAGVQQLLEQYRAAAGEHALVPQQIGATLEAARRQMAQARDALSGASASPGEATARAADAVDALNAAAYQMVRARQDVEGAGSGSGMQEAMERMAQMAQQQGALSQMGAQLLPMIGAGGMQEQIRQLSAQQRALAEQLERLRAETQGGGTAELAGEARDLARQMEAGRLDRRTVERQERLYRRMLDAGRTLQGEETDDQKERQSTTASGDSVRLPPALRIRLDDGQGGLRIPSWEELQPLSPEQRRMVMEYFRLLGERGAR